MKRTRGWGYVGKRDLCLCAACLAAHPERREAWEREKRELRAGLCPPVRRAGGAKAR